MGRHGWKGAPGRGNSIGQGQDLREGMLAQTQWIEGLGAQKMRPGCQQGAVTQGLDLEGSRLGLGQRKGRLSRRQYSGRNGAFGWSWEHGRRREGGGREDGDNELSFVLPSAEGGGSPLRSLPALTFSTSLEGRNISLRPLQPQIFPAGRSGICFVNAACK